MRTILSLILLVNLGCASTVLYRNSENGIGRPVTLSHKIALWGFWEVSPPVNPNQICPAGEWTMVETGFKPIDVTITVLTAGLYSPATVTIYCRDLQSSR